MRSVIVSFACATALSATLLGSAALADPATEAPAATAPAAANTAAPSDPDKIVCKSLPPATGSRIGARRICQPLGVWEAQERQNQQDLSHEQDRGGLFSTPSG